jgi:polyferredoxin
MQGIDLLLGCCFLCPFPFLQGPTGDKRMQKI